MEPPDAAVNTDPVGPSKEAEIVFALAKSPFYWDFLNRFLDTVARLLRVPWWTVHLFLYLATDVAFVLVLNVPKLYPKGGYVSFWGEQIAEFTFTTFMLYHLRESRLVAIVAAARIADGKARLIWLRTFLAPTSWGWAFRRRKLEVILRTWFVTGLVLAVYWSGLLIRYRVLGHWNSDFRSNTNSYFPYPQLIYFYPTLAKAAMMVGGAAHFWWVYGVMAIVRGKFPSTLDSRRKRALYLDCGQAAIRLSMVVTAATVTWILARALTQTPNFWVCLYSVWLIVLFATQVVLIKGLKPFPSINSQFFRDLIAPDFATALQLSALWVPILCIPLAPLLESLTRLRTG